MCDVESFAGANSSTLTIPSVQKSNEGSYHCTVSNCVGNVISECATLTVGESNNTQHYKLIGQLDSHVSLDPTIVLVR